jgi:hypothetical protein
MNSRKLYDKISGSLKRGIIATGLTALVLGSSGCATLRGDKIQENYKVNTLSGLEGKSITQEDTSYIVEGFNHRGVPYQITKPMTFEVGGILYPNTNAIFRTNDALEIINPSTKTINIKPKEFYVIVPINVESKEKGGRTYISSEGHLDESREVAQVKGIKIPKIKSGQNFKFTTREGTEGIEYNIPGMIIKNNYLIGGLDNSVDIHLDKGNPRGSHIPRLPLLLTAESDHNMIYDRENGRLLIEGRQYIPILGKPVENISYLESGVAFGAPQKMPRSSQSNSKTHTDEKSNIVLEEKQVIEQPPTANQAQDK